MRPEKLDLKAMALNQYDNLLISKVNNYLNIRKETESTDSQANIIGKLPGKAGRARFWKRWMAGIRSSLAPLPVM